MKLSTMTKPSPQINLVPILDSIFILIFVFMLALVQRIEKSGLKINLPNTSTNIIKPTKNQLTLELTKNGLIYFENEPITKKELKRELKLFNFENIGTSILIKGDKSANLGLVVEILDLVKQSGFKNVMIETKSKQNKTKGLIEP